MSIQFEQVEFLPIKKRFEIHIYLLRDELKKRASAYPKIIKKAQEKWKEEGVDEEEFMGRTIDMTTSQRLQVELLQDCISLMSGDDKYRDAIKGIYAELIREAKMRKKVYKHYVSRRWMTQEVSDQKQKEWGQLIHDFCMVYLPECIPEYTPTEMLCTGCSGPCGRCEE